MQTKIAFGQLRPLAQMSKKHQTCSIILQENLLVKQTSCSRVNGRNRMTQLHERAQDRNSCVTKIVTPKWQFPVSTLFHNHTSPFKYISPKLRMDLYKALA